MLADIVLGLSYGDEGKGKVTHHLLRSGDYTHCLRFNGGCNAGHTIYHEGKKFVTHHIPAGVFFGIKSIIGPGCVVNLEQFFKELEELKGAGIDIEDKVFIAQNAHIITDRHMAEDRNDYLIGTTKQGNGPAYRDKYNRRGVRAGNVPALEDYVIDIFTEFYENEETVILCEGAQGFGLDIDWGDYPFVTSSHCTAAGALLNGIPPQAVRKVYGIAKAYDTYVGAKAFHGKGREYDLMQTVGNEFGATTGRPRQCNWLDMKSLGRAIKVNGVTDVVINKVDVLREMGLWRLRYSADDKINMTFRNEQSWKQYIKKFLPESLTIQFSDNPERI